MTISLEEIQSAIDRIERNKINNNWKKIVAGLSDLKRQIDFLAGDQEVDVLIERIETAIAEATTAAENSNQRITELNDVNAVQFHERQNEFDAQLAHMANNIKVNIAQPPYNASANGADMSATINQAITDVNTRGGGIVYIPRASQSYMVDALKSIVLKDDVTIELGSGATIEAIANSAGNYAIIKGTNVSNVAIVGNGTIKGDRATHTGTNGEWGMGIDLRSCSNVIMKGFKVVDCWGDGIYLGSNSVYTVNKNIVIENVVSDNNRRQGLSVTSIKGLTIRDSEFKNTNGTNPQAGIDFEPNHADEEIDDIFLDNVKLTNNNGAGIVFALTRLEGGGDGNKFGMPRSHNLNISINNCYFEKNGISFSLGDSYIENFGNIEVNNCTFKGFSTRPINIGWNSNSPTIVINSPTFIVDENFTDTNDHTSCLFRVDARENSVVKDVGNYVVKNLVCRKTSTAVMLPKTISFNSRSNSGMTNNQAAAIKNVKIIDPVDVSGVEGPTVAFYRTGDGSVDPTGNVFTDSNGICDYSITGGYHEIFKYLSPTMYDANNYQGQRLVPIEYMPIGQTVTFSRRYMSNGDIVLEIADTSTFNCSALKRLTVKYGNVITIKRISETFFEIINNVGVVLS